MNSTPRSLQEFNYKIIVVLDSDIIRRRYLGELETDTDTDADRCGPWDIANGGGDGGGGRGAAELAVVAARLTPSEAVVIAVTVWQHWRRKSRSGRARQQD